MRPLRVNRTFRWLFLAQFVSLMGSNLTIVAVPYQVYRETHSSLWVGLASLIQLPFLISGSLWGGALGDRGDRRTLLVVGPLVASALSAGLALNAATHHSHLAAVVLLAGVSAGAIGFSGSVRTAVIPQIVGEGELVAAYALNQVTFNLSMALGPALAGLALGRRRPGVVLRDRRRDLRPARPRRSDPAVTCARSSASAPRSFARS